MSGGRVRIAGKVAIQCLLGRRTLLISDERFVGLQFLAMFGRWPDLKNPGTFSEHVCARKIGPASAGLAAYTDKSEVRKYVEHCVGTDLVVPLIGVHAEFEDIRWSDLPDEFVVKCSHGSSYNWIVADGAPVDRRRLRRRLRRWMNRDYYTVGRERNYKDIVPRILIEEYLGRELDEVKVFCFGGGVGFIQHNRDIAGVRHSNLYSATWRPLRVRYGYAPFPGELDPAVRSSILNLAETLARPFDFVRVDLYVNSEQRLYFSELTFNPGGGLVPFHPEEADVTFGRLFDTADASILTGWEI